MTKPVLGMLDRRPLRYHPDGKAAALGVLIPLAKRSGQGATAQSVGRHGAG
jgi:hypothetical protein